MKLRTFILVWGSVLGINLAVMVMSYRNGNGYWLWTQLISVAVAGYFGLRMRKYILPRPRRLSLERARLLSAYDLDVLEAVLRAYDGNRVFPVQLTKHNVGWEAKDDNELFAAFDRLLDTGLLRDGRKHNSEKVLSLLPHTRAAEVLAQELARRSKVHPIGPRSRSSALSS